MVGALYGWITGFGMLLLAMLAARIWSEGLPIWDLLGRSYGPAVKHVVAMLLVVWMTGVLAAQIHGGTAILTLIGLPYHAALALILLLIYGALRVNLVFLSKIFPLCLAVSSMVLLFTLLRLDGLAVYVGALPRFAKDVHALGTQNLIVMIVGVAFLVVTGADYQQFVIAARRRIDAIAGCALAAAFLLLVGALPASTVVAARVAGIQAGMADGKQVIPYLLSQISAPLGRGRGTVLLLGLLSAALSSGAAIARAMTSALASSLPDSAEVREYPLSAGAMVLGGVVSARGQGIIDTMVDLNIVYIASVAPIFISLMLGRTVSASAAQKAIAAGFLTSASLYLVRWSGLAFGDIGLFSLVVGTAVSSLVLEVGGRKEVVTAA